MKEHADYGRELYIPENYQAVYRRIDDELSRCLTHKNAFPGQAKKWKSNLYPDVRKGEIIYEKKLGIRLYMLIEPMGDKNTRVKLYGWKSSWGQVSHWAKFVEDGTPNCPQ
jgi:hypothetical protein